jgi:hypothetical protein
MKLRQPLHSDPEWADEKFVSANFGLGHSPLYNLRKAGKIRSLSTREPGKKYGKRLFHVGSIREYLAEQERVQRIHDELRTEAAAACGAAQ